MVLASRSPRRADLLAAAGYAFDVCAVDVDEAPRQGESPRAYVERLAIEKAEAAAALRPGEVVLGADTAVVVDNRVLGKPRDAAEAAAMLRLLSGRVHEVLTAVAVIHQGCRLAGVETTRVWFDALSDADIARYVATGEPMDKAGAYGIQGWASRFIPRIDGSYTNVVGLPVQLVARLLPEVRR